MLKAKYLFLGLGKLIHKILSHGRVLPSLILDHLRAGKIDNHAMDSAADYRQYLTLTVGDLDGDIGFLSKNARLRFALIKNDNGRE